MICSLSAAVSNTKWSNFIIISILSLTFCCSSLDRRRQYTNSWVWLCTTCMTITCVTIMNWLSMVFMDKKAWIIFLTSLWQPMGFFPGWPLTHSHPHNWADRSLGMDIQTQVDTYAQLVYFLRVVVWIPCWVFTCVWPVTSEFFKQQECWSVLHLYTQT